VNVCVRPKAQTTTDTDTDTDTDKDTDKDRQKHRKEKVTNQKTERLCVHINVCLRVSACVCNIRIHMSICEDILHSSCLTSQFGMSQSKRLLKLDTSLARHSRV